MEQTKINRINELARKAKADGLTAEELAEQKLLRDEYIAAFRRDLQSTLDNAYIMGKDGKPVKISKKSRK